jgi:hypothetical protein
VVEVLVVVDEMRVATVLWAVEATAPRNGVLEVEMLVVPGFSVTLVLEEAKLNTTTLGSWTLVTSSVKLPDPRASSMLDEIATPISDPAPACRAVLTSWPVAVMEVGASPGTVMAYVIVTPPLPANLRELALKRRC